MTNNFNIETKNLLQELSEQSNLRKLTTLRCNGKYILQGDDCYLNLSSNDYLGLSETTLQSEFMQSLSIDPHFLMSNPSSRLITGNSPEYDLLEGSLSKLYSGRSALVLSSGYLVNSGVLPAVTSKGDLIIGDKLLHASIIDGLKLCDAEWLRFRHNDIEHLESLLKKHRANYKNVWIATESLFSMDGDMAPIKQLIELKQKYDLKIYLDEAHAFGVYGDCGEGVATQEGYAEQIDILVATMGKALSSCGAFVITNSLTRELLVNRMRTLIFSTALAPINLLWSNYLIEHMADFDDRRKHLRQLINIIAQSEQATQIIPIIAGENSHALEMSAKMKKAGYWVTAVRYPTVPQGKARVRVSLSAALSIDDVQKFSQLCKTIG